MTTIVVRKAYDDTIVRDRIRTSVPKIREIQNAISLMIGGESFSERPSDTDLAEWLASTSSVMIFHNFNPSFVIALHKTEN